jgi:outer membrane protein OmpA-like peptidoglycan-associated protein
MTGGRLTSFAIFTPRGRLQDASRYAAASRVRCAEGGRNAKEGNTAVKMMTTRASGLATAVVLAGLMTTGCATKNFVRDQVAVVDTRVTGVEGTAKEALDRANAAHKLAEGKFLYEMVLSDDSVKFPVDKDELSPEAEARLNELVSRLKAENKNVYLEIQGHTDSSGPNNYNDQLGAARAEAVRKYLAKQGVALNRMGTISYGEEAPVAPNDTPEGRAQNRRVVIVVLT